MTSKDYRSQEIHQIAWLWGRYNWTKQSIFQELSYWKDHLIRHCLDVMHVQKNVIDNIMHTMMNSGRTKDNEKAMMDLEEYCGRHELNL